MAKPQLGWTNQRGLDIKINAQFIKKIFRKETTFKNLMQMGDKIKTELKTVLEGVVGTHAAGII
jgi:hypothetical protein